MSDYQRVTSTGRVDKWRDRLIFMGFAIFVVFSVYKAVEEIMTGRLF